MSSAKLVPRAREHSSSTSSSGSLTAAPPTPPLVLTSKTSPAQARLSNSQASSSQSVLPLGGEVERVHSPMEAKKAGLFLTSGVAVNQSVKEEDGVCYSQKKTSGSGGRSSLSFTNNGGSSSSPSSLTQTASDKNSSMNKRYIKMGILMSDAPSQVSPYQSHHGRSTGISSSQSHTPPFTGATRNTCTSSGPAVSPMDRTSPSSSAAAAHQYDQEYRHSPSPSSHTSPSSQSVEEGTVNTAGRPYMEEERNGFSKMINNDEEEVKAKGYEVIDLKDVSTIVMEDQTDGSTVFVSVQNAEPSPPISMKSESLNSEEPMSSPDSGYGNTPEYPNTNASDEAKPVEESLQRQEPRNRVRELNGVVDDESERDRHSGGGNGSRVEGDEESNKGQRSSDALDERHQQQQLQDERSGVQLTRPSTGSSSSAVVSDGESREARSRGDTEESLFSVESIISSPDRTEPSVRVGRGGVGTQVFERQKAKIYLGRQQSVPSAIGTSVTAQSSTTPRNQHPSPMHYKQSGPFHMSPSSGSLNNSITHSSKRYSQPVMSSPLGFSELHPSHPSHPSQPRGISASQSLQQIQRKARHSPEPRKKKFRSGSLAFTRSTEIRSSRSVKASPLSQVPNEKDYFQVTDELAKENSHFAVSEALLAVIEQYKANQSEQELELSSPRPPLSPLSPPPGQAASTPGSMTDSPNYPVSHWETMSTASTSASPATWTPPGSLGSIHTTTSAGWPPTGSVGGISSWGSFSSISATDGGDPGDSLAFRRPHRISLLELISSPVWDNSAESTAQRLLQHMATRLIGSESTENLNMSQMVLKLPTEFLSSLLLDEDLQKSITTSSAHMRGNREWAPPRTQIIYHVKTPSKNLQKDLAAQDYRCTGCGMKVDPSQARYFRFCTYTGRYFCHNCHTGATSIIPAYIMSKWSFKRYPVSNYARDLLNKFYSEPVFTAVPRDIYEKVPLMAQARELRKQLVSIKNYLKTCRAAAPLNLTFEGYAPWTIDLTSYSLEDFVEIKGGMKMRHLKSMLGDAIAHVKHCPLCRGKGFVCEFCQNSEDIIFPFELNKIRKCSVCGCCFHRDCYGKHQVSCPRCLRLQKRVKQRQEQTNSPTDQKDSSKTAELSKDYSSEVK